MPGKPAKAYFFCDGKDERRRQLVATIKSVLNQLVLPDMEPNMQLLSTIGRHGNDRIPMDTAYHVKNWLHHLICEHGQGMTFWILIDGLDEMTPADRDAMVKELGALSDGLNKRPEDGPDRTPQLRIAVASRPWLALQEKLTDLEIIDFDQTLVDEDISILVEAEVREFGRKEKFPPKLMQDIQTELTKKSEGMFLWARLAWERFKDTDEVWDPPLVRQKMNELQRMPRGLESLLADLLTTIKPSESSLRLLKWIVCAARPLTVRELAIATSIRSNTVSEADIELPFNLKASLPRLFGPLIRLQASGETVHLVHNSIKAFFLELSSNSKCLQNYDIGQFHVDASSANRRLLSTCLRYLSLPSVNWGPVDICPPQRLIELEKFRADCALHEFLNYTSTFWTYHISPPLALKSDVPNAPKAARALALATRQDLDINTPHFGCKRLIHYAVEFTWHDILKVLFEREDVDLLVQDDRGWSPLHIACYWGQRELAKELVSRGCWKVATIVDSEGRHALHFLTSHPEMEDVAYIIVGKFTIALPELSLRDDRGSPLLLRAIELGWSRVLDALLNLPSIDINVHDRCGRTAAHIAAICADVSVMKTLVSKKANFHIRDSFSRIPLHYATEQDSAEMLTILLEESADCNVADVQGNTPLHFAMANDLIRTTKALIKHGANLNSKNNDGITPFHQAVFFGHLMLVKWFLANEQCDAMKQSNDGNAVIHWAAKGRHRAIVQLLLSSKRVDVAAIGQYARNVAHLSVAWADLEIMEQIFRVKGVKANQRDSFSETCLHKAARDASPEVFDFVLGNYLREGADINAPDREGRTALHYGAHCRGAYIVKQLIRNGADPSIADCKGRTAEHITLEYGAESVLYELGWTRSRLSAVRGFGHGHSGYQSGATLLCPVDVPKFLRQIIFHGGVDILEMWADGKLPFSEFGLPEKYLHNLERFDQIELVATAIRYGEVRIFQSLLKRISLGVDEFRMCRLALEGEPNCERKEQMMSSLLQAKSHPQSLALLPHELGGILRRAALRI